MHTTANNQLLYFLIIGRMDDVIDCNYARTAIRTFTQKLHAQKGAKKTLPNGAFTKILESYNTHFQTMPTIQLPHPISSRSLSKVVASFSNRWHPKEARLEFLSTFSIEEWTQLSAHKQKAHTVSNCEECLNEHLVLTEVFPQKGA